MDIITYLPAILALVQQLGQVGGLTVPGVVGKVLDLVEPLVPLAVKEVQTLGPVLRNIIYALKMVNPSDDDWVRLSAMEDQLDAAFEAAAIQK